MLMPVALAVLASCSDRNSLAAPLLLGLAWSCSIGGLGTPIGTPPNLILVQVYEENTAQTISFGQWMSWGIPVVLTPVAFGVVVGDTCCTQRVGYSAASGWPVEERREAGARCVRSHCLGMDNAR